MTGNNDKKLYKNAQEAWQDTDQNLIARLEETMYLADQLSPIRLIRFFCWWLEQISEAPVPSGVVDEMFDHLIYSRKEDKSIPSGIYIVLRKARSEVLLRVLQDHHLEEDEANRLIDLEGAFVVHLGEITGWLNQHHA